MTHASPRSSDGAAITMRSGLTTSRAGSEVVAGRYPAATASWATGDTTIGLKGRIIFEAPGLIALLTAHRALEEAVLTKQQNRFKPEVSRKWVELVYEGFYHDPGSHTVWVKLRLDSDQSTTVTVR
jgi:argininosuccinate synthase